MNGLSASSTPEEWRNAAIDRFNKSEEQWEAWKLMSKEEREKHPHYHQSIAQLRQQGILAAVLSLGETPNVTDAFAAFGPESGSDGDTAVSFWDNPELIRTP